MLFLAPRLMDRIFIIWVWCGTCLCLHVWDIKCAWNCGVAFSQIFYNFCVWAVDEMRFGSTWTFSYLDWNANTTECLSTAWCPLYPKILASCLYLLKILALGIVCCYILLMIFFCKWLLYNLNYSAAKNIC